MRVQSAETKTQVKYLVVGLFLDLVLAVILAYLLGPSDSFWLTTFFVWVGIQALEAVAGLLKLLRLFVVWKLGAYGPTRDALITAFHDANFPKPPAFVHSVDDYLLSVAENDEAVVDTRLTAATLMGVRQGAKQNIGVIRSALLDGAHEEALVDFGMAKRRNSVD